MRGSSAMATRRASTGGSAPSHVRHGVARADVSASSSATRCAAIPPSLFISSAGSGCGVSTVLPCAWPKKGSPPVVLSPPSFVCTPLPLLFGPPSIVASLGALRSRLLSDHWRRRCSMARRRTRSRTGPRPSGPGSRTQNSKEQVPSPLSSSTLAYAVSMLALAMKRPKPDNTAVRSASRRGRSAAVTLTTVHALSISASFCGALPTEHWNSAAAARTGAGSSSAMASGGG